MTSGRIFWTAIAAVVSGVVSVAQIPVTDEPRHRVVYEDARVRVLDVRVPPGDVTLEHGHDRDLATVYLAPSSSRIRNAGADWGPVNTRRVGEVGVADYTGQPLAHTLETVGAVGYHLLAVENRRAGGWSQGPPLDAPGTTLLREHRSFRLYAVRATPGRPVRHVHGVPAVVVVVTGSVLDEDGRRHPDLQASPMGQWLVEAGRAHTLTADGAGAELVEIDVR